MNQKTAHLIHRFSTVKRFNPRAVKRAWRRMPRNKRVEMRRMMEAET